MNPADVSYTSRPQPDIIFLVCIEGVSFGEVLQLLVEGQQETMRVFVVVLGIVGGHGSRLEMTGPSSSGRKAAFVLLTTKSVLRVVKFIW